MKCGDGSVGLQWRASLDLVEDRQHDSGWECNAQHESVVETVDFEEGIATRERLQSQQKVDSVLDLDVGLL